MSSDEGTGIGRAAPAAPASGAPRRRWLGFSARWAVSIVGIAYAIHCIHWRDRVAITEAARTGASATSLAPATLEREIVGRDGALLRIVEPGGAERAIDPEAIAGAGGHAEIIPGVRSSLAEADPRLLLLSVALMAPIYFLQALRWRCLLVAQGARLTARTMFAFHLAGSFLGMFLLGTVGADVSRTWWLTQRGVTGAVAIASVVADRALGLTVVIVSAAALLALGGGAQAGGAMRLWAVTIALAAAAAVYYWAPARRLLGLPWIMARIERIASVAALRQAAAVYRSRHREVALAALLSLAAFALLLLATATCGWAVGVSTPLATLLFSLTLVWFVGSLPISIMGFGVMEPLAIALLVRSPTATSGQVMGMLLLARTALLLQVLPGAGVLMWRRAQAPSVHMTAA